MRLPDRSIDAVLDIGAPGLTYFDRYVPLFEDWTGGRLPGELDVADLRELYDQQRGLDLTLLDAARRQLGQHLGVAADEVDKQRGGLAALPQAVRGSTADRAGATLGAHLDRAQRDLAAMHRVQAALTDAIEVIQRAVRVKSDYVAGLDPVGAAGDTGPNQIGGMIYLARTGHRHPIFPMFGMTDADAAEWLDTVFVPEVVGRVASFVEQCETTTALVTEAYQTVAAAMAAVDDSVYPTPDASVGSVVVEPAGAVPAERDPIPLRWEPTVPGSTATTEAELPRGDGAGAVGSVSAVPGPAPAAHGVVDISRVLGGLGGAVEVAAEAVAKVIEQTAPVICEAVADAARIVGDALDPSAPDSSAAQPSLEATGCPDHMPGPNHTADRVVESAPTGPPPDQTASPAPEVSAPLETAVPLETAASPETAVPPEISAPPGPGRPEPVVPEPVVPEPAACAVPGTVVSEPAGPEPAGPEPAGPEPAAPELSAPAAGAGAAVDVGAELAEAGPL
ncbi:hypothetical protein [Skermania piniformis]|uniref:Uncharacterized protein n=1 Tax=Skermania pinensis TaxID=39122 RepID=A0ABX8S9Y4_9ACTN|nr:hypothetical protein [Skermania piniformis]QXQ14632.1 hypothetical protein KV203_04295 [Skermania piniformis]